MMQYCVTFTPVAAAPWQVTFLTTVPVTPGLIQIPRPPQDLPHVWVPSTVISESSIVVLLASTLISASSAMSLIVVPALLTAMFCDSLFSAVPAGTPVLVASGYPQAEGTLMPLVCSPPTLVSLATAAVCALVAEALPALLLALTTTRSEERR